MRAQRNHPQTVCTLPHLREDLIERIGAPLSAVDVVRLQGSCKALQNSPSLLRKSTSASLEALVDSRSAFCFFARRFHDLSWLRKAQLPTSRAAQHVTWAFLRYATGLQTLAVPSFDPPDEAAVAHLGRHCSALRHLSLGVVSPEAAPNNLATLLQGLPSSVHAIDLALGPKLGQTPWPAEQIDAWSALVPQLGSHMPRQLDGLDVTGGYGDAAINLWQLTFPTGLSRLSMFITGRGDIGHLADSLSLCGNSLRSFSLSLYDEALPADFPSGLNRLFRALPAHLNTLRLDGNVISYGEPPRASDVAHLRNLRHLALHDISSGSQFEPAHLLMRASAASLKTVEIEMCCNDGPSDLMLSEVLSALPALSALAHLTLNVSTLRASLQTVPFLSSQWGALSNLPASTVHLSLSERMAPHTLAHLEAALRRDLPESAQLIVELTDE